MGNSSLRQCNISMFLVCCLFIQMTVSQPIFTELAQNNFVTQNSYNNLIDGWSNGLDGSFNQVKGNENLIKGQGNLVVGEGNIIMGQGDSQGNAMINDMLKKRMIDVNQLLSERLSGENSYVRSNSNVDYSIQPQEEVYNVQNRDDVKFYSTEFPQVVSTKVQSKSDQVYQLELTQKVKLSASEKPSLASTQNKSQESSQLSQSYRSSIAYNIVQNPSPIPQARLSLFQEPQSIKQVQIKQMTSSQSGIQVNLRQFISKNGLIDRQSLISGNLRNQKDQLIQKVKYIQLARNNQYREIGKYQYVRKVFMAEQ